MQTDYSLNTLLDLDGLTFYRDDGLWWKIEARRVAATEFIPHGIYYSLTLHNRYNTRIMGYDNSHAVKPPGKFKYAGQRLPYDHKHRHSSDKGIPYEFKNAQQLLDDFFAEVDRIAEEQKE